MVDMESLAPEFAEIVLTRCQAYYCQLAACAIEVTILDSRGNMTESCIGINPSQIRRPQGQPANCEATRILISACRLYFKLVATKFSPQGPPPVVCISQ
jgi:hypothetical protein